MMTSGMAPRVPNCDRRKNLADASLDGNPCPPQTSRTSTTCLSGGPRHRAPAEQVQVQVKHRLPAVGVRVHHHAITSHRDPFLVRQLAREAQHFPEELRVFGLVERGDVRRRDDQQVRRRLRVQVREGEQPIPPLHDLRRHLPRRDLAEDAAAHIPNVRFNSSQNRRPPPSADGGALSTSASCSSSRRCSAVSLVGVQTCVRTWRSPCPPSPSRGSPLPRSRYTVPVCVPGWMRSVARPYGVGTSTSAPSAAWANERGRSYTRSSPRRSKRGSSLMSSTAIRSPGGPLRGPGTPCPRSVR